MSRTKVARHLAWMVLLVIALVPWAAPSAQAPAVQKYDAEYTALIKQSLTDPRINTELVDHLPASDKVPTPLKFLGHIAGQPGYLDVREGHSCLHEGHRGRRRPAARSSGPSGRRKKAATRSCWRSPTKTRSRTSTGTRATCSR